MQTKYYYITEVYRILIHWFVVYAILLFCWSTACFITLLSYTEQFYIAELYLILNHCWGIPYLITLQSTSVVEEWAAQTGGLKTLRIKMGYSEPGWAESREESSTVA